MTQTAAPAFTATAVTRHIVALADRGALHPHAEPGGWGRTRIVLNGEGRGALFGAIYVGRTGRILRAFLTHGNSADECRYDSVAAVRTVLKSWLAAAGPSATAWKG